MKQCQDKRLHRAMMWWTAGLVTPVTGLLCLHWWEAQANCGDRSLIVVLFFGFFFATNYWLIVWNFLCLRKDHGGCILLAQQTDSDRKYSARTTLYVTAAMALMAAVVPTMQGGFCVSEVSGVPA